MDFQSTGPQGAGEIHIHTNGLVTHIEYSGQVFVIAHLFYCALKEIPFGHIAMLMAIERYNKENPNQNETQRNTFS